MRFMWTITVTIGEEEVINSEVLKTFVASLEVFRFVSQSFTSSSRHSKTAQSSAFPFSHYPGFHGRDVCTACDIPQLAHLQHTFTIESADVHSCALDHEVTTVAVRLLKHRMLMMMKQHNTFTIKKNCKAYCSSSRSTTLNLELQAVCVELFPAGK